MKVLHGVAGIATWLSLLPFVASTVQAQSRDSLAQQVTRALAEEGLVGVSWALVTPETVELGAAGSRDMSRGTKLAPTDRVHVGSVAKTLLATGVLALVTDARLSLDARVDSLLPMLRIENPWAAESPLRVRHLLDHTGGLDDARMRQVFTARGDPDAPLLSALGTTPRVRVRVRPGMRFSYSNTSYLLLGMLIEQVTGQRYETWLDGALLAPLGMTRSTFHFVSQAGRNADSALAMGYFDDGVPQDAYAIPVRPATQFTTTSADMATFARFLMGDGVVGGRPLVDSTLLRSMGVPVGTEAARAGLANGYALGLVRRERWGITGKCHLGNIGTFRAILCTYPEQQRAFFASYNSDPENANFDRVDSLLAATLGVATTPAVAAAPPSIDAAAWNGWYVVRPSRFQQFAYLDAIGGVTRVAWDGRTLSLAPLPGTARTLEPVGGNRFRLPGRRAATHVLATSADGRAIITDGLRTYQRAARSTVLLRWIAAGVGSLGLLYVLLAGSVRVTLALRRRTLHDEPLRWPVSVLWLMPVAGVLYLRTPALGIGDPTAANLTAALLTGLLPLAVLAALVPTLQQALRTASRRTALDLFALTGLLQWCVTLAWAGLLPLALWR